MITIKPVKKALIPVDSNAAQGVSSRNYDEFQSDEEIWEIVRSNPLSILRVAMAHCDAKSPEQFLKEGSIESLNLAQKNMEELIAAPSTRVVEDVLWVYGIEDAKRPGTVQMGLGGMAKTSEIRTEETPAGTIIRNEGIKIAKAQGRADLIKKTQTYIGTVNLAVEDTSGKLLAELNKYAASRTADYRATDEDGNVHQVWLVSEPNQINLFQGILAEEPYAFVADGNHRSKAAAMLGYETFLTVLFPAKNMRIAPYNRLINIPKLNEDKLLSEIKKSFEVEKLSSEVFQPKEPHEIGLYVGDNQWFKLTPKAGTFDPKNAAESIDSDIVHRNLFTAVFGIEKATDERLTFVGSNKDAWYLKQQVDSGLQQYALTLPPVTMEQFMDVCKQNRMMPPKSTWFEPKIRSGLVIALLK